MVRVLLACCSLTALPVAAGSFEAVGRVTWVEDGDTFSANLAGGERVTVRIAPIDAPEVCHPKHDPGCSQRPGQPFGLEAAEFLRRLVLNRDVRLVCEGRRNRGREICEVFLGTQDVSQELVFSGLAWYTGGARWPQLKAAELAARLGSRGIWSAATPVRPAVWRERCWGESHICPGAVGAGQH